MSLKEIILNLKLKLNTLTLFEWYRLRRLEGWKSIHSLKNWKIMKCNYICKVWNDNPDQSHLKRYPLGHTKGGQGYIFWPFPSSPGGGGFCLNRKTGKNLRVDFLKKQGYIFWPFPPPLGGGEFLSKMKNREEFEGGLHEKRKGKGGKRRKKEKSDKTPVKIPFWSLTLGIESFPP